MSKQEKKSFLGGAAVLAAAVAIVKIIGAVYKIPLGNIIGDEGKAHFTVAYNIYNLLLTISTAGLPLAISKLTSEAHALGRENEKRKIFSTSIWLFFGLGLVFSLFMFFGSAQLAAFMNDSLAFWSIRALSPAVFCVCLLACMRGYTQGQGNMTPTAVSQILEALCKLGIGLSLAWYFLQLGKGVEISAAGAIMGVTVGTVLSMVFLIFYLLRHRDRTESLDVPESSGTLMKKVLLIGVPITLSNSAMSIITLIDSKIVLGRLEAISSLLAEKPAALYGQYTFGMDLINLPPSFVYPVTMSLIPFAAAAMARKDSAGANRIISSSFRLIALFSLPAGVGLSVLAQPILQLLYPAVPDTAAAAAYHLQILGAAAVFVCLMILTNAILQACGRVYVPIVTALIGGAVKISTTYTLCGNPVFGIKGAPISTTACYAVIAVLNLCVLAAVLGKSRPRYLPLLCKPALAAALMGGCAHFVFRFLHTAAGLSPQWAVLAAIVLAASFYAFLALLLRMVTREDLALIPKGEKIAKILHIR